MMRSTWRLPMSMRSYSWWDEIATLPAVARNDGFSTRPFAGTTTADAAVCEGGYFRFVMPIMFGMGQALRLSSFSVKPDS
jgi:hypothetical protein